MTSSPTRPVNDWVGISLMKSAETEAAVDLVGDEMPDARVSDRDCFYKIERPKSLAFDMTKVGDRLGRTLDTDTFLVNMSTYYGRIVISDGMVEIFSEILPDRFRD